MTTATTTKGTAARVLEQRRPRAVKLEAALQELLAQEAELLRVIEEADAAELDANRVSWSEGRSAYAEIDSPAHPTDRRVNELGKWILQEMQRRGCPFGGQSEVQAAGHLLPRLLILLLSAQRRPDVVSDWSDNTDADGVWSNPKG